MSEGKREDEQRKTRVRPSLYSISEIVLAAVRIPKHAAHSILRLSSCLAWIESLFWNANSCQSRDEQP